MAEPVTPRQLKLSLLVAINRGDEPAARWILDQAPRAVVETALLQYAEQAVWAIRIAHEGAEGGVVDSVAEMLQVVALEVASDEGAL